jgi:hypothetical protein
VLQLERYGHLVGLPVVVGDRVPAKFVFDSGSGITILSRTIAADLGVEPDGAVHIGRRMSGQEIRIETSRLRALTIDGHRLKDVPVCVLDLAGFSPALRPFEGMLSLGLFEDAPLRLSYGAGTAEVLPSRPTFGAGAVEVPMRVDHDGPSVDGFVALRLPDGRVADVEIDTGSDTLILHDRYFDALVPDPSAVRTVEGSDETGHRYRRRFGTVHGAVSVGTGIGQVDPPAMFQEIIHDGLLGDAFLRRYTVTMDPGHSRLVFETPVSRPGSGTGPGAARPRAPT